METPEINSPMGKLIPPPVIRPKIEPIAPQVCKCCGAPLRGSKCDYCGVEYHMKEGDKDVV